MGLEKNPLSPGDLAEKVATEFVAEATSVVDDVVPPTVEDLRRPLSKIRFSWTNEDRDILDRLRIAAEVLFGQMFAGAIDIIDTFYARMRVPLGTGPDGRMHWQVDEDGRMVEDFSQLTGQDLRETIVGLQRVLLEVTPEVSKLMLEAIMAHTIAKDSFDEGWFSVVDGTQGDRTAKGNQLSRQDRWHALFRLYLYETANSFLKELNAFIRRLENIDYRQSREQQ